MRQPEFYRWEQERVGLSLDPQDLRLTPGVALNRKMKAWIVKFQCATLIAAMFIGLTLCSRLTLASEYCTKEQYQNDQELIEGARKSGALVEGPKGFRDSILVQEGMWFGMNYPQQLAFMQSFECSLAGLSGKHLLFMDVRSLATGRLLATWLAGTLKPTEAPPTEEPQAPTNPGTSEGAEDENRVGLTGEARATFIGNTVDECTKRSPGSPAETNMPDSPRYGGGLSASESRSIFCLCYANIIADNVSIKELKEISVPVNREAAMSALGPKLEAAAKDCRTN
jgi:hypothetical protein